QSDRIVAWIASRKAVGPRTFWLPVDGIALSLPALTALGVEQAPDARDAAAHAADSGGAAAPAADAGGAAAHAADSGRAAAAGGLRPDVRRPGASLAGLDPRRRGGGGRAPNGRRDAAPGSGAARQPMVALRDAGRSGRIPPARRPRERAPARGSDPGGAHHGRGRGLRPARGGSRLLAAGGDGLALARRLPERGRIRADPAGDRVAPRWRLA